MKKGDKITVQIGKLLAYRVFIKFVDEDTIAYGYDVSCQDNECFYTSYKSVIEINGVSV